MGPIVLVALIALPILEIATFIEVGRRLGVWPTLALVMLSAVIGAALMRHQGLAVLSRVEQSLRAGRPPVAEVFDGFCVVAGGLLLVMPGFVTDALGLALLLPPVRALIRRALGWHLKRRADRQTGTVPPVPPPKGGRSDAATVIEGDFTRLDDEDARADAGTAKEPVEDKDSPWRRPDR